MNAQYYFFKGFLALSLSLGLISYAPLNAADQEPNKQTITNQAAEDDLAAALSSDSEQDKIAANDHDDSQAITPFNDPTFEEIENNPDTLPSAPVSPQEAEQLNKLYSIWKTQLDALVSSAQHLSQLIATQKINPEDRYAAFEWLQKFAMLAGKTTKLPYAPITVNKLMSFFTFNKMLISSLAMAFKNNFDIKPHIEQLEEALHDLELNIKTPIRTTLPFSLAENYAMDTNYSLQQITNQIGNSGLTWYNHLYRGVLSLDRRLNISKLTKFGLTSAAVITGLLYVMPLTKHGFNYGIFSRLKESLDGKNGGILQNYGDHNQDEFKRLQLLFQGITAIQALAQFGLFAKLESMWSELDAYLKGSTADMSHHFVQFIEDFTLDDPMFDSVRHLFGPFEKILNFMADPDRYIRSGQKVPKCLLLTGAPGSGKSHSVLALAGSLNQLLLSLGRPEKLGLINVEPWDLAQIEDIIKQAQANAPCILFIDEFHLFGGGAQISSNAMFLAKLLTELDRIEKNSDPLSQIFIIAATNRPDLLAKALLRPGRFGPDGQIRFPMPDFEQRKSVIKALCQKSAIDLSAEEIDHLALITQGCSYSSISKTFEHAGFKAKERAEGITYNHLYQAVNTVIRVLNPRVSLSETEKEIIACHLAGAAFAHTVIPGSSKLDSVTLQAPAPEIKEGHDFLAKMENQDEDQQYKNDSSYGAIYTYNTYECAVPHVYENETDPIKLILAGPTCQKLMLGHVSSYHKEDRQRAYVEAQKIKLNGLTMSELPKDKQNQIKHESLALVEKAESELLSLFEPRRETIRTIADELKQKTFLTNVEIQKLVNAAA